MVSLELHWVHMYRLTVRRLRVFRLGWLFTCYAPLTELWEELPYLTYKKLQRSKLSLLLQHIRALPHAVFALFCCWENGVTTSTTKVNSISAGLSNDSVHMFRITRYTGSHKPAYFGVSKDPFFELPNCSHVPNNRYFDSKSIHVNPVNIQTLSVV